MRGGRLYEEWESVELPEVAGEVQLLEQGMGFVYSAPAPRGIAAILIPLAGQGPAGGRRKSGAAREIPTAAPAVNVLFRPEEEHGLSIKDDVVPPSARGESKVDDAIASRQAVANRQGHGVTAATAGGEHASVGVERRENAERVPDAVAKPTAATGFGDEWCGHGGEGVGHEHFAAGLKDQHMGVVHAAEGGADVRWVGGEVAGERGYGRDFAGVHDHVVDAQPEFGILKHGGNVNRFPGGRQGMGVGDGD